MKKLSEEEYRAHEALNVSRLCLMDKSPMHYFLNETKETEAMRFGTTIHMAFLEPAKFKALYVVEPDTILGEPRNNRLKAHKEYMAAWRAEQAENAVILSPEQFDSLGGILNSLQKMLPHGLQELMQGQFEVCEIKDMFERPCKGRADIVVQHPVLGKTVVDLKKVGKPFGAHPDHFKRDAYNLCYDAKAAWYKQLFEADSFVWIVVEEKAPHAVAFYNAEPFLDIGHARICKWMDKLKECEKTNHWPWYTTGIESLYPSDWQAKQHEFDV